MEWALLNHLRDNTTTTSMKIVQFSRLLTPWPSNHLRRSFFDPFDLGTNFKRTPSLLPLSKWCRVCERTTHSNWPHVFLPYLSHKQYNDIKGWLYCLTSESKGRFLVSNIFMFGSEWCLVMAKIKFSLI